LKIRVEKKKMKNKFIQAIGEEDKWANVGSGKGKGNVKALGTGTTHNRQ